MKSASVFERPKKLISYSLCPFSPNRSALNAMKGTIFGGAVAFSQSFALTFADLYASSKAQHKAIDMAEFFTKSQGKMVTFVPAICA